MSSALRGHDLALVRGERCLFRTLGFSLDGGDLLLVEGPNGSGKTSLLRVIAGLVHPDEGYVSWEQQRVDRSRQAYHANLAWMSHRPGFKGDLSSLENLRAEAGMRRLALESAPLVLARLGLAEAASMPFRLLSAGQQRRAALARVLLAEAKLWLLDEPFSNLDTAGQAFFLESLAEHLAAGGLCVMASHQPVDIGTPMRRIVLQ